MSESPVEIPDEERPTRWRDGTLEPEDVRRERNAADLPDADHRDD